LRTQPLVQDVLVVQVREYDQLVVEGVVVGEKASPVVLDV
jgi:hypothetical protein